MSFPNFNHMELVSEDWDESDFLADLQRLLIVPLVRDTKESPRDQQVWGTPFFWTPSVDEFEIIEREWRDYVARIARGEEKLPGYSKTELIHVRPHARNKADMEPAPVVGRATKRCFWLNPSYVSRVVLENDGLRGAI
jgi:DNA mismatch repair protein MutH